MALCSGRFLHAHSVASPDRAIPAKARASSFKAEERYGLIWVCLGQPRTDIPEFPPEFHDPSFNWKPYSTEGLWKANAARMLENLADYSHFPFVHPGTLGDPDNPECEPILIEPLDGGFLYDIPQPVNRLRSRTPGPDKHIGSYFHSC